MDVTSVGTYITTRHDDVDEVVGRGVVPIIHDQSIFLLETRISAEYGIADGVAIDLVVPFKMISTRIHYLDASGAEVALVHPEIHHRNETLTGLGDLMLFSHFALAKSGWSLDGRIGLTLPIGQTQPDPFKLGDMGLPHEHFQFGTGTFNLIYGLDARRHFKSWSLGLWGAALLVPYENDKGYQAGNRYAGGISLRSSLKTRSLDFGWGFEAQNEEAERWHGQVMESEGNRGRLDLLIGTDLGWNFARGAVATVGVKVPVYTRVVGGQLEYPILILLGLTGAVDIQHHHDHEHEDHEEWARTGDPAKTRYR
jgi:hypothetical protein